VFFFFLVLVHLIHRQKRVRKLGAVLVHEKCGAETERYVYRSELEASPAELVVDVYTAELGGLWGGREEIQDVFKIPGIPGRG
jgi:hypothetical protein